MRLSGLQLLLLCIVGEFLGLDIFLKGFFPVKKAVEGYATFNNLPREPLESMPASEGLPSDEPDSGVAPIGPVFGRLVVILIDALRADFVYGERNKYDMPYTRMLIGLGGTRSFLARAHPPTVTMPRIKALTSGTIPGFVDIVLNLDSTALVEDNLISQMHRQGRQLYFYGDDTWMKLFPGHFADADGTTSFFVTDYTEVDNNVTRHIQPALFNPNWDALVLHYLGLDHIGHLGGPTSPLISPKLKEMDGVIRTIHETIREQDKSLALPTLIMLCGDHGMSDAGSHGGASNSETITPMVFISSAFKQVAEAATPHPDEVYQIDVAATLSLLMGLPIPQNSLGVAVPTMLEDKLSARQHLRALQLNGHQLSQVLKQNVDSYETDEGYLAYQHALRSHAVWLSHTTNGSGIDTRTISRKAATQYVKAMRLMKDKVASSLARYDLHAMGCGLVLMWLVLFLLCYGASSLSIPSHVTSDLTPSFLLLIGCCLAAGITHVALCTAAGGATSELLCAPSGGARARSVTLILIGGSLAAILLSALTTFGWLRRILQSLTGISWFEKFLLAGTVGHTLTLAASSFVEEEHQTWYFLTLTFTLATSIYATASAIGQSGDKMAARVAMGTAAALVVSRLLRAWNQTGMKWADQPDIGDWLVRPENKVSLSVLTCSSFAIIYIVRCYGRPNYRLLAALLGAYLYRYATGAVTLPVALPTSQKGTYEAWVVYSLVIISLAHFVVKYATLLYGPRNQTKTEQTTTDDQTANSLTTEPKKKNSKDFSRILKELCDIHVMLMALLLRPHNSGVVAMSVLLQHCIVGLVLPWLRLRLWAVTLAHIWMGQAAFFAQGNSNSLATVDISAGYVGMSSYIHSVAGLLTAISTYAGPMLWLLRLLVYITEHHYTNYRSAYLEVAHTLALSRALPLAIYTGLVTLQRYHLFVWSVFSPKLLYQTMNTYVVSGGIVLVLVHCGIARWFRLQER
ncbi:GPI ethanolamine phosphate transferase 2-like [Patiria miniata]|uniref:GPI ethanolamine phosphate transferase 2 C-terminal domain-containing protein n=1 Tax=Patiria miniata TaxID=46514 RepID=A0A914AW57_PATMI|nr:GPI ethanolamine phosphate transferase 2-like [Patiria miniata]XP_038067987.1 GPI ethanolamine phosphate transferase 2-like [Patiria miniata]